MKSTHVIDTMTHGVLSKQVPFQRVESCVLQGNLATAAFLATAAMVAIDRLHMSHILTPWLLHSLRGHGEPRALLRPLRAATTSSPWPWAEAFEFESCATSPAANFKCGNMFKHV